MPSDRHTALTAVSDALRAQILALAAIEDLSDVGLVRATLLLNDAIDVINVAAHAAHRKFAA